MCVQLVKSCICFHFVLLLSYQDFRVPQRLKPRKMQLSIAALKALRHPKSRLSRNPQSRPFARPLKRCSNTNPIETKLGDSASAERIVVRSLAGGTPALRRGIRLVTFSIVVFRERAGLGLDGRGCPSHTNLGSPTAGLSRP